MVWRGRSGEDGLVGFWHSGIDVGDGTVIHYAGMDGVKTLANAVIAQTPMSGFVGDARRVHVVCYAYEARAGRLYPPEEVVARARSRIGHKRYDLLYDNCESFARWAKTGREVSQQAQGALLGLVIGAGSVALGGGLFGGLLTALCVHKYWDRSSNRSAERVAAYRPGPAVGGGGVYAGVGGGGGGGGSTAGMPVAPVVLGPAPGRRRRLPRYPARGLAQASLKRHEGSETASVRGDQHAGGSLPQDWVAGGVDREGAVAQADPTGDGGAPGGRRRPRRRAGRARLPALRSAPPVSPWSRGTTPPAANVAGRGGPTAR